MSSHSATGWTHEAIVVNGLRLAIVVFVLSAWQFLPYLGWLRAAIPLFDPFFISSPSLVVTRLEELAFGLNGQPYMWPFLLQTMEGTFLGFAIGTALGAAMGLMLSNSVPVQKVLSPFVTVLNAMPRIALIPIFVIICGPTLTASVLTVVAVVFFIVFYNAYAGGISVPLRTVQNVRLLGAASDEIMRYVRLPYVLLWTFTALPNAISFALVAAVTAEILTGTVGMGRLLLNSISNVDATLTFTVVLVLSMVGVTLVTLTEALQRRVLHWWERS